MFELSIKECSCVYSEEAVNCFLKPEKPDQEISHTYIHVLFDALVSSL